MKTNTKSTFITEAFANGATIEQVQNTVKAATWEPTKAVWDPSRITEAVAQLANRERAYRVSDYVRKIGKKLDQPVRRQDVLRIAKTLGLVKQGEFLFGKV